MSRLPFEFLLALRYLRPKRTFVSVITLISVVGVTLGVAVLIIVISVMSGFDRQLREKILGFNTHLKVLKPNRTMPDYREVMSQVATQSLVKAVAPFVIGRVLLETAPQNGQSQVDAPYVRGIDASLETNISILPQSIVSGVFDVSNRGLLVGTELAYQLRLEVGDLVTIYSPEELRKMRASQGRTNAQAILPDEYEVRGIFDVGYYEYNVSVVMTSLEDAQELYVLGNDVHGLLVMLEDPYAAPAVAQALSRRLGPEYRVTTWMQENASLLNALIVEKNVMFYLLFFIMIVAALCILSALITFVVQKTREIGMLKALGATDLQVSLLFLSQGALVGALGDLAGYGLGMLALAYRNEFLHFMNRMTGFELFPASIYGFTELPALIEPRDILLICGSAWVVCTLGGVIPAWRAGRLKPVEALRYE
ncbi:MAG TPA: FtsX-like permease family protein [Verrucomicrobiota bacterium]|jgi:lipoprotein-releasing system permease protein|nr:FtsX-like permease family protein [Verrucomicrobiota bacterium]HRT07854.1 FtsX-like permease family protein [Candidatus Paceibacterota bacterium]HRT57419.1 FtsX-like permease family protein [Candidatus Paceibacterota bacterium]